MASKSRAGVSLEGTDAFDKVSTGGFDTKSMDKLCEIYLKNMELKHTRVHQVVFDDLVKDPLTTSKKVYDFLGRPWTEKEDKWVRATFDNPDCDTGSTVADRHADCRSDSAHSSDKWKDELPNDAQKH